MLGVRECDLDDLRASILERGDCAFDRRLRIVILQVVHLLRDYAHRQPCDALGTRAYVVIDWLGRARRIPVVVTRDHRQDPGAILDGHAERGRFGLATKRTPPGHTETRARTWV